MNILIPVLSLSKSGGFRVLTKLANTWIEDGHSVTFVVLKSKSKPYYPLNANLIELDYFGKIANNTKEIKNKKFRGLHKFMALYLYIKNNYKIYDCIIANSNLTTYPVWLASKTNNFYYIQAYEPEFYVEIPNFLKRYLLTFLAWMSYYLPLKKIVNADLYKQYKNINTKYIVYPGLDLNIYSPKLLTADNKEKLVVGCIGRKELWKGAEDVGAAVEILHDKGLDIEFKVAFYPTIYNNHTLEIPNGDDNLANFYRSLDILIAPGHIQLGAIHYPVIEAMACLVPVITTGYFPANKENAYIVPVKNPLAIANTIEFINNNYELAYKKAIVANNNIQMLSWVNVSKKFISIVENEQ